MSESQRRIVIEAALALRHAATASARDGWSATARYYAKRCRAVVAEFGDRDRVTPQVARQRALEAA